MSTIQMKDYMAIQGSTNKQELLGKFLYFSLANVMAEKESVERICADLGIYCVGRRISEVDAFRNATGSLRERKILMMDGHQKDRKAVLPG